MIRSFFSFFFSNGGHACLILTLALIALSFLPFLTEHVYIFSLSSALSLLFFFLFLRELTNLFLMYRESRDED